MEIWILLIKWLENVPLDPQLRKYDSILFLNYFESLLEQWTASGSPKRAVSSHTAESEPECIHSVNRLALKKRAHMLPSHCCCYHYYCFRKNDRHSDLRVPPCSSGWAKSCWKGDNIGLVLSIDHPGFADMLAQLKKRLCSMAWLPLVASSKAGALPL